MVDTTTDWTLLRRVRWLVGRIAVWGALGVGTQVVVTRLLMFSVNEDVANALASGDFNARWDSMGSFASATYNLVLAMIGVGWAMIVAAVPGGPSDVPTTWQERVPDGLAWRLTGWPSVVVVVLGMAGMVFGLPNPEDMVGGGTLGLMAAQYAATPVVQMVGSVVLMGAVGFCSLLVILGFLWRLFERAISWRAAAVMTIVLSLFVLLAAVEMSPAVREASTVGIWLGSLVITVWVVWVRRRTGTVLPLAIALALIIPLYLWAEMYTRPMSVRVVGLLVAAGATVWLWRSVEPTLERVSSSSG